MSCKNSQPESAQMPQVGDTVMQKGASAEQIEAFWNKRAQFGVNAGSDDFNVKELEMREILARTPEAARVLDLGCGNGMTLIRLAHEKNCSGVGIDYAAHLVALANEYGREAAVDGRIEFQVGRVPGIPKEIGLFDVAITERCLINIIDAAVQYEAFCDIRDKVKAGGTYLMIENSQQAYEETNDVRRKIGVPPLKEWHALYLDETTVRNWQTDDFILEEISHFTSTYYFLSRVVYARLAYDAGQEPRYDSPINRLALELPSFGTFGPTKLWVWRKRGV